MRATVFALILLTAAIPAWAANTTIWRCGESGKIYADSPCPGGRAVAVADPRSSADEQAARDRVQRLQTLGQQMRDQRLEDERQALRRNAGPANLGPSKPAAPEKKVSSKPRHKPAAAKRHHRLEDDGTWSATGPVSRRARD